MVCDKGLTLRDLIGTLKMFFDRLGLKKLRFKPAYNPYTEPSMEIFRSVITDQALLRLSGCVFHTEASTTAGVQITTGCWLVLSHATQHLRAPRAASLQASTPLPAVVKLKPTRCYTERSPHPLNWQGWPCTLCHTKNTCRIACIINNVKPCPRDLGTLSLLSLFTKLLRTVRT